MLISLLDVSHNRISKLDYSCFEGGGIHTVDMKGNQVRMVNTYKVCHVTICT